MSKYDNDNRVVLHDDGTAALPDPGGNDGPPSGDWLVEFSDDGSGFVLRNEGGDQGYAYDEGAWHAARARVPKVFDTADDAIAYVIGAPHDAAAAEASSPTGTGAAAADDVADAPAGDEPGAYGPAAAEATDDATDGDATAVGVYRPTFQWLADPGWELGDQMHLSRELQAGQIVADDIHTHFQGSWPQMWQEAAQTWGTTPEEMREAVRAYGHWLTAVADSATVERVPECHAGDDAESSDVDDGDSHDRSRDVTTVDTVKGCDNADIEIQVDLVDKPGCSTVVLRLALWDDRDADNTAPPHDIYQYDDWISLDLNDARQLRAALDEKIAQIEAHDAAFNSDEDDAEADATADTAAVMPSAPYWAADGNEDAVDVAADGM